MLISRIEIMDSELKVSKKVNKTLSEEIQKLKRKSVRDAQYNRQDNVEFSGIPDTVQDSQLEEKAIALLKVVDVDVKPTDIVDCHRLPRRGTVIARFVNRKYAVKAIANSRKLKDVDVTPIFGVNCKIYINRNLTPELMTMRWKAKRAKLARHIHQFGTNKRGVYVQTEENGRKFQLDIDEDLENILPSGVSLSDFCQ